MGGVMIWDHEDDFKMIPFADGVAAAVAAVNVDHLLRKSSVGDYFSSTVPEIRAESQPVDFVD